MPQLLELVYTYESNQYEYGTYQDPIDNQSTHPIDILWTFEGTSSLTIPVYLYRAFPGP